MAKHVKDEFYKILYMQGAPLTKIYTSDEQCSARLKDKNATPHN